MDDLYIVIPAYNEEDNIENTIQQWYPIIERYNNSTKSQLVIIDDGSTDDTYHIIKKMAKNRPYLVALTKENGGHSSAVLYGYRYAIKHHADFIFQTDSDGQTDPEEFYRFWDNRNNFDALLGNRKVRGDGLQRKMIEKLVCLLLRIIFGVKIPDANAPYRLMKTDLVKKHIDKLPRDYNLPNIMLSAYFCYYKESVYFIEISFKPRQGGTNSVNIKKIFRIGTQAVKDFWKLKKQLNGICR